MAGHMPLLSRTIGSTSHGSLGPQKVAFSKGNGTPAISGQSEGWGNMMIIWPELNVAPFLLWGDQIQTLQMYGNFRGFPFIY